METFLALLEEYGLLVYALLFAYCSLKSGALPLFAGFAAYKGALDPSIVLILSFAGGYLGDELRFALARRYGEHIFARWTWTQEAIKRARILMARYGKLYLFIYRYPKGMRTIGAIPVGLGEMTWRTFSILNAASAALWAGILVGTGYFFGNIVASAADRNWGVVSVALLFGFFVLTYVAWRQVCRSLDDVSQVR